MSSDEWQPPKEGFVDVLEISDCRFPGQLSRTLAAEISAQNRFGWSTAIAQLNGPLVARVRPFHPDLTEHIRSGRARLLLGRTPIEAAVTIVRHPVLLQGAVSVPPVRTGSVVVVAAVGPHREDSQPLYDPVTVEQNARELFGHRPTWAPGTAAVREQILHVVPDALMTDDWLSADPTTPFDVDRHRRRIAARVPVPTGGARRAASPEDWGDELPAVLFITSNGAGMGHLTRLLAYARRLTGRMQPHFLSLSQAVGVVGAYDLPYEYLASTGASGLGTREWNALFAARITETVNRIRPEVVVFDGTYPYAGIAKARKNAPEPKWIWSRRAMWKAEHDGPRGREQVQKAALFDEVLEPGDFAESYDRGMTVGQPARHVGPVTLLDTDELTGRATARSALGLPAEGRLALLSLGAGNINDTSGDLGAAVEALRKLEVEVCVTQSEIGIAGELPPDVHIVRYFPLSKYSRAFDVAISAAGYNSFHELLRFGVPTLFVPNAETSLDDQVARAGYAADKGLAHSVDAVRTDQAVELLTDLLTNGNEMIDRVYELDPGNGAAAGADFLLSLSSASRFSPVADGDGVMV